MNFNMAHSGNLALYAVTADVEIGVDVEEMREVPDMEQIAARYFCDAEAAELKAIDAGRPASGILSLLDTQEAYIKAVGDGLYIPWISSSESGGGPAPSSFISVTTTELQPVGPSNI